MRYFTAALILFSLIGSAWIGQTASAALINDVDFEQPIPGLNLNGQVDNKEIQFVSPTAGQTVSGQVQMISAISQLARRVEYLIQLGGEENLLGLASLSAEQKNWQYIWDSRQVPNGLYLLKAQAFGEQEVFLSATTLTVEVKNTEDSVGPIAPIGPKLTITAPLGGVINGDVFFTAKSTEVMTSLDFVLENSETRSVAFTGKGNFATNDPTKLTWIFGLMSKSLENGNYKLYAKAKIGEKEFVSLPVIMAINNLTSTLLAKVEINTPGSAAKLSGQLDLQATTSTAADKLEFRLNSAAQIGEAIIKVNLDDKPKETGVKPSEAVLTGNTKDKLVWKAEFKTDLYEDGLYNLSAVAYKGAQVLESQAFSISIFNDKAVLRIPRRELDKAMPFRSERGFLVLSADLNNLSAKWPIIVLLDGDNDGVSDNQEFRFGTDPYKKDTDNDGYEDLIEVRSGYNPTGTGKGNIELSHIDQVLLANKKLILSVPGKSSAIKINKVRYNSEEGGLTLVIEGEARPKKVIGLALSGQVVFFETIKVGDDGRWSYSLTENIQDGNYSLWVTEYDTKGQAVAVSAAHPFEVKDGQIVGQSDVNNIGNVPNPLAGIKWSWSVMVAFGALLILGIILIALRVKLF